MPLLKVNMQVIVIKFLGTWVLPQGTCINAKKVLKTDVFSGAVILIMLKVKQKKENIFL